ncbi:PepSY domain-containing protein [Campylobacter gastrosuis]|uniref:PepSY domain-containing protein n=1 Tax=Campylobacter gastrosuis TaxID=2974576 RepID=A0ABT7HM07_9BACT|nr:PepSY domain-containing protein [Campylobacter gastrosuis]MDL0087805.1 PepSY domain-containing protein [Campylobacter gastrosuis]MDL0088016.1 PepSY domain-containing protein [Campylobacter gastrosuis]
MNKLLSFAVLAAVLGTTGLQAAITYDEALKIAQKNLPGSSVKDISIDVKNGTTFYKVESFKDDIKQKIKIDATNSQIVEQKSKNKKLLPSEAIDFSKFSLSIDEAASKALALEAGWSLDEADLDNKNGTWIYKIELKRDKSERKVIINAQTGEIISNRTK